jgi:hypothetical protein
LSFHVAPGTKLLKTCKVSHELRIDDIGMIMDELPFVSERSGGWISSSQSIEFVDDYLQTREGLPLEFRRAIRDASASGKANVTRQNGQVIPDSSRSVSRCASRTSTSPGSRTRRTGRAATSASIPKRNGSRLSMASSSCSRSCPRAR